VPGNDRTRRGSLMRSRRRGRPRPLPRSYPLRLPPRCLSCGAGHGAAVRAWAAGITSNALSPCFFATEYQAQMIACRWRTPSPAAARPIAGPDPWWRSAGAAVFLASPGASYSTDTLSPSIAAVFCDVISLARFLTSTHVLRSAIHRVCDPGAVVFALLGCLRSCTAVLTPDCAVALGRLISFFSPFR